MAAIQNRQDLLDAAAASKSGVIQNYEGWRVSLTGKRFRIKGVTLFNIVDFSGMHWGPLSFFASSQNRKGGWNIQMY